MRYQNINSHQTIPYNKAKIFAVIQNACLGAFLTGFTGVELSFTQDDVMKSMEIQEQTKWKFIFIFSLIIGGLFGTILYKYLNKYSSKRMILILADLIFIASVQFRFETPQAFTLQRFLKGISNGLNLCTILLYIKDIAPDDYSDQYFGIVVANVVSIPLGFKQQGQQDNNSTTYWKFIFCFPVILAFIRAFVLIFVFDYDTINDVNEQLQNQSEQSKDHEDYDEKNSKSCKIRSLFAMGACSIQQLSGINAIIQLTNKEIKAYSEQKQSILFQLFVNLILLVISILMYFQINRIKIHKRRIIMCVACFVLSLLLIYIIWMKNNYYFIGIAFYILVFSCTLGPLTLIYIADISKEVAISRAFITYWISYLIVIGIQQIDSRFSLLFCVISCLIGSFLYGMKIEFPQNNKFDEIDKWYAHIGANSNQLALQDHQY